MTGDQLPLDGSGREGLRRPVGMGGATAPPPGRGGRGAMTMGRQDGGFRSRLSIFECEGHGRYFEVYEGDTYAGTFERDGSICAAFGGRVAEVYGYAAYEAACEVEVARDPEGYDFSDVTPVPVLCIVRPMGG